MVFILGADTGVTKSDLAIWREHLITEGDASETRFVVLNKIDTMWDIAEHAGAGRGADRAPAQGRGRTARACRCTRCSRCRRRRACWPRSAATCRCCRPAACRRSKRCWARACWASARRCCAARSTPASPRCGPKRRASSTSAGATWPSRRSSCRACAARTRRSSATCARASSRSRPSSRQHARIQALRSVHVQAAARGVSRVLGSTALKADMGRAGRGAQAPARHQARRAQGLRRNLRPPARQTCAKCRRPAPRSSRC